MINQVVFILFRKTVSAGPCVCVLRMMMMFFSYRFEFINKLVSLTIA